MKDKQKILLEGKYILVNYDSLEEIKNFLINLGYVFAYDEENKIKEYFSYEKGDICIFSRKKDLFWVFPFQIHSISPKKEELNISIIFREKKLKRILK